MGKIVPDTPLPTKDDLIRHLWKVATSTSRKKYDPIERVGVRKLLSEGLGFTGRALHLHGHIHGGIERHLPVSELKRLAALAENHPEPVAEVIDVTPKPNGKESEEDP